MKKEHRYEVSVTWTGNRGTGTSHYRAYGREHQISAKNKTAPVAGSSDPAFRGDPSRYNPEELLVAALSACHMLTFLHLCAEAGIVVISYQDTATGAMAEHADGTGELTLVTLHPAVVVTDPSRIGEATSLHSKAYELCFIVRSVKFPVEHKSVVTLTG